MKYKIPDILVLLLIKVMPGSYTADFWLCSIVFVHSQIVL